MAAFQSGDVSQQTVSVLLLVSNFLAWTAGVGLAIFSGALVTVSTPPVGFDRLAPDL